MFHTLLLYTDANTSQELPTLPIRPFLDPISEKTLQLQTRNDSPSQLVRQMPTLLRKRALQQHLPLSTIPQQRPMHKLPRQGTLQRYHVPKRECKHGRMGMYDLHANKINNSSTKTQNRPGRIL